KAGFALLPEEVDIPFVFFAALANNLFFKQLFEKKCGKLLQCASVVKGWQHCFCLNSFLPAMTLPAKRHARENVINYKRLLCGRILRLKTLAISFASMRGVFQISLQYCSKIMS